MPSPLTSAALDLEQAFAVRLDPHGHAGGTQHGRAEGGGLWMNVFYPLRGGASSPALPLPGH